MKEKASSSLLKWFEKSRILLKIKWLKDIGK